MCLATVNLYHFESQGNEVPVLKKMTKPRRIPDSHLAIVDEIVFVDADPATLLKGFCAGDFYDSERIEARAQTAADLRDFYTWENLTEMRAAAREFLDARALACGTRVVRRTLRHLGTANPS